MLIEYHGIIAMVIIPYPPKKVQTYPVWRHSDVIIVNFAQNADLQ